MQHVHQEQQKATFMSWTIELLLFIIDSHFTIGCSYFNADNQWPSLLYNVGASYSLNISTWRSNLFLYRSGWVKDLVLRNSQNQEQRRKEKSDGSKTRNRHCCSDNSCRQLLDNNEVWCWTCHVFFCVWTKVNSCYNANSAKITVDLQTARLQAPNEKANSWSCTVVL